MYEYIAPVLVRPYVIGLLHLEWNHSSFVEAQIVFQNRGFVSTLSFLAYFKAGEIKAFLKLIKFLNFKLNLPKTFGWGLRSSYH